MELFQPDLTASGCAPYRRTRYADRARLPAALRTFGGCAKTPPPHQHRNRRGALMMRSGRRRLCFAPHSHTSTRILELANPSRVTYTPATEAATTRPEPAWRGLRWSFSPAPADQPLRFAGQTRRKVLGCFITDAARNHSLRQRSGRRTPSVRPCQTALPETPSRPAPPNSTAVCLRS